MRLPHEKISRWQLKEMTFLLYPFRWPANSPQSVAAKHDEHSTRALVARLAKGNVLLQSGRYQTQEQLEARAARMKDYRFIEGADD